MAETSCFYNAMYGIIFYGRVEKGLHLGHSVPLMLRFYPRGHGKLHERTEDQTPSGHRVPVI